MTYRQHAGAHAEDRVRSFLQQDHFIILASNYTSRWGEIDIIAQKDALVVFVEVKMRTNPLFDTTHVITHRKKQNIIHTARYFLSKHPAYHDAIHRFDVAIIESDQSDILYIPNAFELSE